MKTNYLLLILFLGLFSCSQDQSLNNVEDPKDINLSLRTAGDGTYEVLGYGYDITDEYMGETAVKRQVVNIKAFLDAGNVYKFDNPLVGIITDETYLGENATTFTKDIMKKTNFNGSAAAFPNESKAKDSETAFFSGSVTKSSTSSYSYSSKYSFARADLLKKHRKLFVDASPVTLSKYLYQQFSEDLNSLSADQLVLKYGTHVMTDITIGGFYKANYNSAIIEQTSSSTKSKTVEAGLKVNLGVVGLSLGSSTATTETIALNQKNTDWSCVIKTVGGTTNGHTVTISPGNTSSITLNMSEWAKSVDDKNSKLVELNWNATYPLYDFVTDPTKKAQIKTAVLNYIASKQLKVMEIVPLYQFSKNGSFHYNTAVTSSGWNNQGVTCYVHLKQESGSVPLYQFSKNGKYHYNTATTSSGWSNQGITCYVYKTQVPGTVPLYQFSKNGEFHYNTAITSSGWNNQGITCYVFPGLENK